MTFADFFKNATGNPPYDWQTRLATATASQSRLIDIPTGLGKTAGVVLAWLWNYTHANLRENGEGASCPRFPRRLVYCLPMRTLVEQTVGEIETWLKALAEKYPDNADLQWLAQHSPITLMGGEELDDARKDWHIYPEKPTILVGTQDMLLSRALNRGYAASRARWPIDFALLNNDCLWIMDEVQLMGAGLWTSSQLDWLRQKRFNSAKNCVTWWMSATIGTQFLATKDRTDAGLPDPEKVEITSSEAAILDILKAIRPVASWQPPKQKDRKDRAAFIVALSAAIHAEHTKSTLSLVVCNTVAAAQEIFTALASANNTNTEIILITSRFRPSDRKAHLDKLLAFESARKASAKNGNSAPAHNGLICVSTQVIEAGVDISARHLWTELAPWPSTLQRLGRLNRDGKYDTKDDSGNHISTDAKAFVFEIPVGRNAVSPYEPNDLKAAKKIIDALVEKSKVVPSQPIRNILSELSDATISTVHDDIAKSLEPKPSPFPRAFEIHGLFSTEPDVFGGFTDVSSWVRDSDKNADVTVFWRNWDAVKKTPNAPEHNGPAFRRDEGCSVAIHRIRNFVEKSKNAFVWNDRIGKWESIKHDAICPGMVVMLPAQSGGYDVRKGWTGDKTDKLQNTPSPRPFDAESEDDDKQAIVKQEWIKLDRHLDDVAAEMKAIANALALSDTQKNALIRAAALHDIGKSLPQWQDALPMPHPDMTTLYAKAPSFAKRAGMRHEAGSALAAWHRYYGDKTADFPALTIYLIAAHHGLVRTVLNSRPAPAKQPNVAGIPVIEPPPVLPWHEKSGDNWQLDFTPIEDGANGTFSENTNGELVFTPSAPGWSALVADLLGGWEANTSTPTAGAVPENEPHSLNPFQLAFLETLLRAADCRVSANKTKNSSTEAAKP